LVRLISILLFLLPAQALFAIDLPKSQLLPPAEITLAQQTEEQPSFTEVIKPGEEGRVRKSPWRALGISLLLPGGGQYYVESNVKAKIFAALEVGLWSAFFAFRQQGSWRKDDFRLLAEAKAGADLGDKDDRFLDVLGFYDSREEYNKLAGVYTRDRQYFPDNSFYFWKWDSENSRLKYRELKNDSRSYFRKANFALGFIIANHVISAADAYFAAKRHNRGIESGFTGVNLYLTDTGGLVLTLEAGI
jgi:hypothetical protein